MEENKKIHNYIKVFGISSALFCLASLSVIFLVYSCLLSTPLIASTIYYYGGIVTDNFKNLNGIKELISYLAYPNILLALFLFYIGPYLLIVLPLYTLPATIIVFVLTLPGMIIQSLITVCCFIFLLLLVIMAYLNKRRPLKAFSITALVLSIIRFIISPIEPISLLTFIFSLIAIIGALSETKEMKKGA